MMNNIQTKNIGIFGAGAFGTAIAIAYAKEFSVSLFSFVEEHVYAMQQNRKNEFLPNFELPQTISIDSLQNIHKYNFDYIFWAFPIKPSIFILSTIKNEIFAPLILCSKGILDNGILLFDWFEKEIKNSTIGYMAGPNFATDLATGKYSCANIGARNIADANIFAEDLSNNVLKLFPIDDVVGMQICGAIKNVIAIACGIAVGLKLGENVQAALLTMGLCEMKNLGLKLDASESTFYSFCGIGDLVLTAFSETSRNMKLGKEISQNSSECQKIISNGDTYEGCHTLAQVLQLAREKEVDMPVCSVVFDILFKNEDPKSILNAFN